MCLDAFSDTSPSFDAPGERVTPETKCKCCANVETEDIFQRTSERQHRLEARTGWTIF
jgi:hypothetical protein